MFDKNLLAALENKDYPFLNQYIEDHPEKSGEIFSQMKALQKMNELDHILAANEKPLISLNLLEKCFKILKTTIDYSIPEATPLRGDNKPDKPIITQIELPFGSIQFYNQENILLLISISYKELSLFLNEQKIEYHKRSAQKSFCLQKGQYSIRIDNKEYQLEIC